jgi:hypothetical protein
MVKEGGHMNLLFYQFNLLISLDQNLLQCKKLIACKQNPHVQKPTARHNSSVGIVIDTFFLHDIIDSRNYYQSPGLGMTYLFFILCNLDTITTMEAHTHSFNANTAKLEAIELCHGELEQHAGVKGGGKKYRTMIK